MAFQASGLEVIHSILTAYVKVSDIIFAWGELNMYDVYITISKCLKQIKMPFSIRYNLTKLLLREEKQSYNIKPLTQLNKISPIPNGTSISNHFFNCDHLKYDLSIIVPAYNCEKYIIKCMSSIIEQKTKYKYHIIAVNDGSTDHTLGELISFQKKYPNLISLISQANKGFSGARNRGIKLVNSRYIAFVDSDDYVTPNFVNSLLTAAYNNNSDIVEGSYQSFGHKVKLGHKVKRHIHKTEFNVDPFEKLYGYPWGKIYKVNLFNNVQFPPGFWFEDTVAMYRIWPKATNVTTISDFVYNYRVNLAGITHSSVGNKKSLDSLYVTIQLLKDLQKLNELPDQQIYKFTLSQMIMNFKRITSLDKGIIVDAFYAMSLAIKDFFPSYDNFDLTDPALKKIETALKNQNYSEFVSVCIAS